MRKGRLYLGSAVWAIGIVAYVIASTWEIGRDRFGYAIHPGLEYILLAIIIVLVGVLLSITGLFNAKPTTVDSSLELLNEKYISGQIQREQYLQMKEDIEKKRF